MTKKNKQSFARPYEEYIIEYLKDKENALAY